MPFSVLRPNGAKEIWAPLAGRAAHGRVMLLFGLPAGRPVDGGIFWPSASAEAPLFTRYRIAASRLLL